MPRDDFKNFIIAMNLTNIQMPNKFYIIFGKSAHNTIPLMNLTLTRENATSKWTISHKYIGNTTEKEEFRNAFVTKTVKNGTCLILIRSITLLVLDEKNEEVSLVHYASDWCKEIRYCLNA